MSHLRLLCSPHGELFIGPLVIMASKEKMSLAIFDCCTRSLILAVLANFYSLQKRIFFDELYGFFCTATLFPFTIEVGSLRQYVCEISC